MTTKVSLKKSPKRSLHKIHPTHQTVCLISLLISKKSSMQTKKQKQCRIISTIIQSSDNMYYYMRPVCVRYEGTKCLSYTMPL